MRILFGVRLALLAFVLLGGPARAGDAPAVKATLARAGGEEWLLTYHFRTAAPAWFFPRSNPARDDRPWRPQSWTIATPGVRLTRHGRYDVLESADGGPLRTVTIRVKPFTEHLKADYIPFLRFSDGGVAIYADHYQLIPLQHAADADGLPVDLNGKVAEAATELTVRDPRGRLLADARVRATARLRLGEGEGQYVYAGPSSIIAMPALAAVVDPGLPAWIRTELNDFTPRLFGFYADRLGPAPGGRPVAYVAWGGDKASGVFLGGSVLKGTVVLDIRGDKTVNPTPAVLSKMRWFFGHEAAHFWLGQAIHYDNPGQGWITEGGADLMAVRALEKLTPGYDPKVELQRSLNDCQKTNGPGLALRDAAQRNDVRSTYACGAMLLLAAEATAKRKDPSADAFTWLRGLIDANRADREVTAADWLARFEAMGVDAATVAGVRTYLDQGVADPKRFFIDLFTATGVPFAERDGKLILT